MSDSSQTVRNSSPETLQRWRQECPRLEGTKIFLELLNETHLTPTYVAWLNDPEVTRYTRHGGDSYSLEKARIYLSAVQSSAATVVFAIHLQAGGQHVGNISLNDISWANHSGEISIILGERKSWGSGVGSEAVYLVKVFAFERLALHRVFVGMTVDNTGMISVAKKNGFAPEGVLKHAFFKNGCYQDIAQWYCLNPLPGEVKA